MSFSDFKSLSKVAERYNITCLKQGFTSGIPPIELTRFFRSEIEHRLKYKKTSSGERFLCEAMIVPLLIDVLKIHRKLNIWSHECDLETEDPELSGFPDYVVSYKGETEDYEQLRFPLLLATFAKKDDFGLGWAQTLAGMIACQKFNKYKGFTIYGIATNGTQWEFATLQNGVFIKDENSYSLFTSLSKIAGIIHHIYTQTALQVEKHLAENENAEKNGDMMV